MHYHTGTITHGMAFLCTGGSTGWNKLVTHSQHFLYIFNKNLNFIHFTKITHGYTSAKGDLVGWRINHKQFRSGKTIGISS